MAAGVTPAVSALTEVLKEAVANSKIIAALDKIIGQTLGLLVDLILLPFLPILIWVLKGLLGWVIDFGKWWNDFWKGDGKFLIDGIKALGNAIVSGLKSIIDFGIKLGGALVELGIGFLKWLWQASIGAVPAAINIAFKALGAVYDFLVWVWGVVTKGASVALGFLFTAVPGLVKDLINWVWDIAKSARSVAISLWLSIAGYASGIIEWLWNVARGASRFFANLDISIPEPVKSILGWLRDVAGGVVSFTVDIAKTIGGAVGSVAGGAMDWARDIFGFAKGGVVPGSLGEPRIVKAHGGETITPAGAGGNVSLSISGTLFRDEEDMYQRVFDRIRAELWRQNV